MTLARMQATKNRESTLPESVNDDPHEKVIRLQAKLDIAVNKIKELTEVLNHLHKDYDAEKYYEDSAKLAADAAAKRSVPAMGAANYGGNASTAGRARSDMPTNS